MELWQKKLQESITDPRELGVLFRVDPASIEKVSTVYPFRITPHYLSLIREPDDPLWKQVVPDIRELDEKGLSHDPLNEEVFSPLPGIVHRYGDRVLFLVAGQCAAYCRFCTRKRLVGRTRISFSEVFAGIDYIRKTPEVRDVLISGGDPLLMEDRLLGDILDKLRRIPHVEIIRIGTRLPVTLPERITINLCDLLKKSQPLYINTHFNHPLEITPESTEACARLADAGIPLGNQTVLLRGVNDSPEILVELFRKLLQMRVKPYYLHQMDLTCGTDHFRTSVETGLEIMGKLRGNLAGLGIPAYVIDLPGGKGKVPILPNYLETVGNEVVLRSPCGEAVSYPNLID